MTTVATDTLYTTEEDAQSEKRILDRIRTETSRIGHPMIHGNITRLADGWFLDQVKVSIRNSTLSEPVVLDVVWSEEKDDLVYLNALGDPVQLTGNAYEHQEGSLEQKTIKDVFSRYKDLYLALDTVDEFGKDEVAQEILHRDWPKSARWLLRSAVSAVASLIFLTAARISGAFSSEVLAVIGSMLVLVCLTSLVGFALSVLISGLEMHFCGDRVRRNNYRDWNEDRAQTFYDVFDNAEERRIFIQTFLELAEGVGIEDPQDLSAWKITAGPNSPGSKPNPSLIFTGKIAVKGETSRQTMIFDGKNFFLDQSPVVVL